jgi:hypothetical protein
MKSFNKYFYIFIILASAEPSLVYGAAAAGSGYKVKSPRTVHVKPHAVQVRTKEGIVVNFSVKQTGTLNDLKMVARTLLKQNLKTQKAPSEFEACAVQSQQNLKTFNDLALHKEFTSHYASLELPAVSDNAAADAKNKKDSSETAEAEWKTLVDAIVLDQFTSCFATVLSKKREARINLQPDVDMVDIAQDEAIRTIDEDNISEQKFFNGYLSLTGAQLKDITKLMIEQWDIVKQQYITHIKSIAQKKKAELNSKCCCQ